MRVTIGIVLLSWMIYLAIQLTLDVLNAPLVFVSPVGEVCGCIYKNKVVPCQEGYEKGKYERVYVSSCKGKENKWKD